MIEPIKFASIRLAKSSALAFLTILALIFVPEIGRLEGHLYPVVTDFRIVSRKPTPDGRIALDVQFEKIRDCKFIEQNWSVKLLNHYWVEFDIYAPEDGGKPPRSKRLGKWEGQWILKAPSLFAQMPMKVEIYHECWGPLFWTTDTFESDPPELVQ